MKVIMTKRIVAGGEGLQDPGWTRLLTVVASSAQRSSRVIVIIIIIITIIMLTKMMMILIASSYCIKCDNCENNICNCESVFGLLNERLQVERCLQRPRENILYLLWRANPVWQARTFFAISYFNQLMKFLQQKVLYFNGGVRGGALLGPVGGY